MFIYVYITEELLQITYKGSSARLQNERRKSVFSAVVFCSRGVTLLQAVYSSLTWFGLEDILQHPSNFQ